MKGYHSSNLTRHVQRYHPQNYESMSIELEQKAGLIKAEKRKRLADEFENDGRKKITIVFSREQLKEACVEMITTNARPFNLMGDSGFQKVIAPFIQAFAGNFAVNAENIRACIPQKAHDIRNKLKNELAGKLVSIKVDSVKRLSRSILGKVFI